MTFFEGMEVGFFRHAHVLWLTIASIPCFVLAWKQGRRGSYSWAIALLLLGGGLLRTGPSLDPFLHTWDERYHALVAKNMMTHPMTPTLYERPVLAEDPLSWTEGRVWLHKPPFTLWCMAASFKLFGVSEFAARLPSLIVSTLGIVLCFGFARSLYGPQTGFIAAFLFAIQGAIIEFASGRCATDHVDTMFAFLISAGIVAYQALLGHHRWIASICSGMLLGLAILTKWLPALIVLPVAGVISLWQHRRPLRETLVDQMVIIITCAIIAAPWSIYVEQHFPLVAQYESRMNVAHFTHALDGQSGGPLYYFERLRIAYGELVYLPCLWFIWRSAVSLKRKRSTIILIWWLVPYAFFSFAGTKMAGYVLPSAIPVLTICALFWIVLERKYRNAERFRWLTLTILIALLALPARYCIERIKPFQDLAPQAEAKRTLIDRIGSHAERTVIFGCKQQYEAMFYTGCVAYERPLDPATSDSLIHLGYRVLDFGKDPR